MSASLGKRSSDIPDFPDINIPDFSFPNHFQDTDIPDISFPDFFPKKTLNKKNTQQYSGKYRACGSGDMLADRQTDRHTDVLITILLLRHRSRGRSKKISLMYGYRAILVYEIFWGQTNKQTEIRAL